MLLEKGGAVGVRDALGRNVLHTAAEMESQHALPVMRMLLAEGSPARDHVNDQDQDGRTPLYFAARNAHKSAPLIVRLLIGMDMHLSGTLRDSLGFSGILRVAGEHIQDGLLGILSVQFQDSPLEDF